MFRTMILAAVLATPISALSTNRPAEKAVELQTSDSQQLSATYFPPKRKKSEKSPAPGVLLVHDAGGDRHQLDDVAIRLQKSGFGVLAVDLRGHGDSSEKGKDWTDLGEDERNRSWALATRDIEAAGQWLLAQEEIHSTNLSLVGLGSGCALTVRHARRDENVRCVVLLAPNAKDFGFDVAADLLKIEGLPTYVVTAKDDEDAKAMVEEANDGTSPYVELDYAAARVASVLEDRKTPGKISTWVKGYAMPKRGRG